jgi:hypothetical protein
VAPLLDKPWILDIDTTIKPLYGKQEGAEVSCNPHKPGRPSHRHRPCLMAGRRPVLGAGVKAGQAYLFERRLSKNVKRHVECLFRYAGWQDAGQGWQGMDSRFALPGGEDKRRVVVLRRPLQGEMLLTQEGHDGQSWPGFIETGRQEGQRITGDEYAVLVTHLTYEVFTLGQPCRDRADAENAFDELKKQWGWGGFTPMTCIAANSRRAPWP